MTLCERYEGELPRKAAFPQSLDFFQATLTRGLQNTWGYNFGLNCVSFGVKLDPVCVYPVQSPLRSIFDAGRSGLSGSEGSGIIAPQVYRTSENATTTVLGCSSGEEAML